MKKIEITRGVDEAMKLALKSHNVTFLGVGFTFSAETVRACTEGNDITETSRCIESWRQNPYTICGPNSIRCFIKTDRYTFL